MRLNMSIRQSVQERDARVEALCRCGVGATPSGRPYGRQRPSSLPRFDGASADALGPAACLRRRISSSTPKDSAAQRKDRLRGAAGRLQQAHEPSARRLVLWRF